MRKLSSWIRKLARKGQTTSEYVIILGLVALVSIGIIMLFGNQVRALFGAGINKMAGEPVDATEYSQTDQVDEEIEKDLPEAFSNP